MENFGKRTIATLAAAFLLAVLGWGFTIEQIGQSNAPAVHCDRHLIFTPIDKT